MWKSILGYNTSMRIVTVIPIAKGISKDTLTYFTKKDVAVGSIVSIPLRSKTAYGLVTGSREATEIKSELKSLTYSIRKIDNIESHSFLSPQFIDAVSEIADYGASSIGAVLSVLIPKTILEGSDELSFDKKDSLRGSHETLLLQSDDEERYATYKSLIREEFAKNRSVFFCLPTTEDLLNARPTLEKGIEKFTYILHSGLPKKEILTLWKKIIKDEHPILLIATGSYLSIPRNDWGTFIFDKESSRGYKMQTRPFIRIRTAGLIVTINQNAASLLLNTITLERSWEILSSVPKHYGKRKMAFITNLLLSNSDHSPQPHAIL